MIADLLVCFTLLLLPYTTDAVKVTYTTTWRLPENLKHKCWTATDGKSKHVFIDKSKKTIVCCPKKGKRMQTTDEGKEKESGCCFADGSIADPSSQLPCCVYGIRQEKEAVVQCVKRELKDSLTLVAINGTICKANKTHLNRNRLFQEFLFEKQDQHDSDFKIPVKICCKKKEAATSDLYDPVKCCEADTSYLKNRIIDGKIIEGCKVGGLYF